MNKFKADVNDLKRIMKVLIQCYDRKSEIYADIQLVQENGRLTIRSTNGTFLCEMSMNVTVGSCDPFCIDGDMFNKVINISRGQVEILTDGRSCVIKGTGRTRLPIISKTIYAPEDLDGKIVTIQQENFRSVHGLTAYARATTEDRPILTGTLLETDEKRLRMVALDGYMMAIENTPCSGDIVSAVVPGAVMDLIDSALLPGDELTLVTNGKIIQAKTSNMTLQCALMAGEYIDYHRLLPKTFKTEIMIDTEQLMDALKGCCILNSKLKLIRMSVGQDELTITNNTESADYEARIPCQTTGDVLIIAFAEKYLIDTIGAIRADKTIMKFNTPVSPVYITVQGSDCVHMCLPVRLQEAKQDE
jgi:DNA polymerase-3 subunit beta